MPDVNNIHFVGIGGTGMSGIAEVLLNQGYNISGSDLQINKAIERLTNLGAKIFIGHDANNVQGTDIVVTSTAIKKNNPEYKQAKHLRIPVMPRAQMLADLMRSKYGIAITGTHGKTTTTSLIASLLTTAGLDPTYVIGGLLNSAGSNAALGASEYFVAEADESDASFLYLLPKLVVVTNIDADHMQTYHGDFKNLQKTFLDFIHRLPFNGVAVVCLDDENIRKLLPEIARPTITYGFSADADVCAQDFKQQGTSCCFTVKRKNKDDLLINLNIPGKYNVLNSLAAIAVADVCEASENNIYNSLMSFKGVDRRLQNYGDTIIGDKKVLLIDDYGHHPREISVVLETIRAAWPNRRIVHIFQPHRYTRTKALFEDFAESLSEVDALLLLEVYAAGEKPIINADSRALARSIRNRGKIDPIFVKHLDDLSSLLPRVLQDDDVLLVQGAGSVGSIPGKLIK